MASSSSMDPATRKPKIKCLKGKVLGRGAYGTVNLGFFVHGNSWMPTAIKSATGLAALYLRREKMFLDKLRGCPQVIGCYGDAATKTNNIERQGQSTYNVFIEYAPGGSLLECLPMHELTARRYARSVLRGLVDIHRLGVVHCDIKPDNVMLWSLYEVKIVDFGLALRSCERTPAGCYRGTPYYTAPECIAKNQCGAPADVWAFGCTLAEMLLGEPATAYLDSAVTDKNQFLALVGEGRALPEIPANMSELGKNFLSKCFQVDVKRRWTAEMLLRHPYMAEHLDAVLVEAPQTPPSSSTSSSSTSNASRPPRLPHEMIGSRKVQ